MIRKTKKSKRDDKMAKSRKSRKTKHAEKGLVEKKEKFEKGRKQTKISFYKKLGGSKTIQKGGSFGKEEKVVVTSSPSGGIKSGGPDILKRRQEGPVTLERKRAAMREKLILLEAGNQAAAKTRKAEAQNLRQYVQNALATPGKASPEAMQRAVNFLDQARGRRGPNGYPPQSSRKVVPVVPVEEVVGPPITTNNSGRKFFTIPESNSIERSIETKQLYDLGNVENLGVSPLDPSEQNLLLKETSKIQGNTPSINTEMSIKNLPLVSPEGLVLAYPPVPGPGPGPHPNIVDSHPFETDTNPEKQTVEQIKKKYETAINEVKNMSKNAQKEITNTAQKYRYYKMMKGNNSPGPKNPRTLRNIKSELLNKERRKRSNNKAALKKEKKLELTAARERESVELKKKKSSSKTTR